MVWATDTRQAERARSPAPRDGRRKPGRIIDAALWGLSVTTLLATLVLTLDREPILMAGRWDKLAHAGAYATMTAAFLMALAWRPGQEARPARHAAVIVAAVMGLAITLELVQGPLPGRSAEAADALSGMTGAAVGWAAWRLLRAGMGGGA